MLCPYINYECFKKHIKKENIMKKALVILLALTMVVSMFAVAPMSASAADELIVGQVAADYKPEGEAVKTAEEFLNMKADGTYYLANDITIDETYYDSFTGTFDGNGKIITTSVTIFENLDGTVKNLTIAGSITIEAIFLGTIGDSVTGGLAHYAAVNADTTIDNVCNNATITSYACGIGGLVGRGCDESTNVLTIKNCVNNGNITTNCDTTSNYDSGGIIATHRSAKKNTKTCLIIDNCVNNGTINADGRPGGIAGNVDNSATITNCTNNGAIQAIYNYCGGIAGRLGAGGNDYDKVNFVVENCVNNADLSQSCSKITSALKENELKTAQIGGMVGYVGKQVNIHIKNCTNNGNISAVSKESPANFGGMVGGMQSGAYVAIFENCVNNGNISAEDMIDYVWYYNSTDKVFQWGTKNSQVAGIVALAYATKKLEFINCINNGNISVSLVDHDRAKNEGYGRAAGLSANAQLKKGSDTGYMLATGCINNGKITVKNYNEKGNSPNNNAGGLFAYVLGGNDGTHQGKTGYGAKIEYCANLGEVTGTSMVSGLIGYINSSNSVIQYNIVAGKLTNTTPEIVLQQGETVQSLNYQQHYTFNYNGKDYYFVIPYNADKITITGTTVVPHYTIYNGASGQTEVADGATYTTIKGKWCYWFDGSNSYCFKATDNGEVTISGAKAYVNGVEQDVVNTSVVVFDHQINTRALVWSNQNTFAIDLDKNFIQDDIACADYAMGYIGTFGIVNITDESVKYSKAQFASGEVAYELNEMIGEPKFYQNLLPSIFAVDEYPTPDATHAKVIVSAGQYTNQLFEMNPDVTPPTGDATVYVVIALAVATVSLAALAVVKKRKEN